MTKELVERNNEIVRLSATYNTVEIAELYGITRERVRQILNARGVTERQFVRHRMREIEPMLGKMSDSDIARLHGIAVSAISNYRNRKGIEAYSKPIGCEDCATDPYAKGLCRNCYARNLRKGK